MEEEQGQWDAGDKVGAIQLVKGEYYIFIISFDEASCQNEKKYLDMITFFS